MSVKGGMSSNLDDIVCTGSPSIQCDGVSALKCDGGGATLKPIYNSSLWL